MKRAIFLFCYLGFLSIKLVGGGGWRWVEIDGGGWRWVYLPKQNSKIKVLKQKVRRKEKKVLRLKVVVQSIKEKQLISLDSANKLETYFSGLDGDFKECVSGHNFRDPNISSKRNIKSKMKCYTMISLMKTCIQPS